MVACSHYLPAGVASAWHPDGAVRDPFGDIWEHDGVAVQAGEATGVSLDLFAVSGIEQRLEVRHHVEHAAEQIDIGSTDQQQGIRMGVEAFHRLQHFGFGHRTLSACVVSSPIMRWPCSRKPSFLTILPAGHDRNAFLRPAACQNCSGNPLRKSVCRRRVWRTHRSEEHTSELQSLMRISYAVFRLKKKTHNQLNIHYISIY